MSETKKVVINVCFGGFGLSDEAERRCIGCGHVELIEPSEYYGNREGWEKRFADDQARDGGSFGVNVVDGKIVMDNHRSDEARTCPKLIEVVEAMGDEAAGSCASLRIVEIPADVAYEISDYDGSEHIAEAHRTWR